ncbi:MAG: flagellar hook-basal body complex protein [candidate division Zixibacteria bacterium]|nr:flagellar hook-basal body complex protein [candidate division Zixibacteria bacterium]
MMASLYAGVSGLKNHQTKLNVIGNNIANVNTIGYKSGRVNFQEALVQTYKGAGRPSTVSGGTNAQQLGLGMQVATIDNLFLQGGLETTGQITDMAIQGAGFFILADNNGDTYYTRAGAFGLDAESNLVDPATGLFVQGRMADSTGAIPSLATLGNITLPFGQQDPASATEVVTMANNIDVTATTARAQYVRLGGSNVQTVSGIADDGVGGVHTISVTGAQAQHATFTGTTVGDDGTGALIGALGSNTSLGSLGVTIFDDFGLTVDGSVTPYMLSGLSEESTVGDVIDRINQIDGLSAELNGGQVEITRTKAGAPAEYSFSSTAGTYTLDGTGTYAVAGNIAGVIFGVNGTSFTSAGGAATTYVATDVFTPDRGFGATTGPVTTQLDLVFHDRDGTVIGLAGMGGGGVTIDAPNGLTATGGDDLIIRTEPTVHSTSINIFDSQGGRHTLTIEFARSIVPNRWDWQVSTLDNETVSAGRQGFVAFNSDGSLNTFEYFGGASAVTIDPNNGADLMQITLDAGTISGFDGLTGFSAGGNSSASMIAQDGYGLGMLDKIDIDQAGNISGIFTNGVTRILARISLADFTNQAGLRKAGRSMYQTSPNSGDAVEGIAGQTISGIITSGALESSSVDIAAEFTSMITAQRGYQANARIITTSDSLLEELVNLKR